MLISALLLVIPSAAPGGPLVQDPVPAVQSAPEMTWYHDLNEARQVAARDGKHVLIDFTGTGWCGFCKRLDQEVFSKPEFKTNAHENFVCVALDFDARLEARKDRPHPEENNRLRDALQVEGFPTVVLMTPKGVVYDRYGYEQGGPGPYVDKLLRAHEKAMYLERNVPALAGAVARAKSPEEAAKAADEAILLLTQAGEHPLAKPLVPLAQAALKSEKVAPERQRAAVLALSAASVVDDTLIDLAFQIDPRNKAGLPEAAIAGAFRSLDDIDRVKGLVARTDALLRAGPIFDKERASQLYGDSAYWTSSFLKEPEAAAVMARFALTLDPKDPSRRRMLESLSAGR